MSIHYAHDEGDPSFRDVSEFSPVRDDEHAGEGVEIARLPEPAAALTAATARGAAGERWVNSGMIADEYADYRGWS